MDNNQQPTGYNFDVNGKLLKEHECSICLHLIRNATELPCSDLMCRDCLVYYEEKELEQNENADFCCPLCRTVYDRSQACVTVTDLGVLCSYICYCHVYTKYILPMPDVYDCSH